jgi:hypothetical protein
MHVAFHFMVQPAEVYSQRLGLSVLDAIRTFCDVCARNALNESPPREQSSRSRSFGHAVTDVGSGEGGTERSAVEPE